MKSSLIGSLAIALLAGCTTDAPQGDNFDSDDESVVEATDADYASEDEAGTAGFDHEIVLDPTYSTRDLPEATEELEEMDDPSASHSQIIGGFLQRPASLVQVAVPLGDGRARFCSGTVVGPRTILTAFHCVAVWESHSAPPGGIKIKRFLDPRAKKGKEIFISVTPRVEFLNFQGVPYTIDAVIPHSTTSKIEGFVRIVSLPNLGVRDLVLIRFREPIRGAKYVTAGNGSDVALGSRVKAAGYGVESATQTSYTVARAKAFYADTIKSDYFVSLTIPGPEGTTSGDCGGPLYHDGRIVGVHNVTYFSGSRVSRSLSSKVPPRWVREGAR